jgi:hypothetical protein
MPGPIAQMVGGNLDKQWAAMSSPDLRGIGIAPPMPLPPPPEELVRPPRPMPLHALACSVFSHTPPAALPALRCSA